MNSESHNPQQPLSFTNGTETVDLPVLDKPPTVVSVVEVRDSVGKELALPTPNLTGKAKDSTKADGKYDRQAEAWLGQLLSAKPGDLDQVRASRGAVEALGQKESKQLIASNALLDQPLRQLAATGSEGSLMAKNLGELKQKFEELDPSKINFFSDGFWGMLSSIFGRLPFVGSRVNLYFTKFQASGNVIGVLFDSLEASKGQLVRDIGILQDEQQSMRILVLRVQELIKVGMLVDAKLEDKIRGTQDAEEVRFMKDELLFPLRQRITDLQQQVVVNQQGIIAYEVLIRNNRELIRGVDRCWTVTLPALRIGVMTAMALANQRVVLDKLEGLNKMADTFIDFNAKLLRQQGSEIQKRASTAQLSDTVLARAIDSAIMSLDEVSKFRQEALVQMSEAINGRDASIQKAEKSITRMERGNQARPVITLDLDMKAAA